MLPSKGLYRLLITLPITVILILVIRGFLEYPLLATVDKVNILLTFALAFFASVEVYSTVSQAKIEKGENRLWI